MSSGKKVAETPTKGTEVYSNNKVDVRAQQVSDPKTAFCLTTLKDLNFSLLFRVVFPSLKRKQLTKLILVWVDIIVSALLHCFKSYNSQSMQRYEWKLLIAKQSRRQSSLGIRNLAQVVTHLHQPTTSQTTIGI